MMGPGEGWAEPEWLKAQDPAQKLEMPVAGSGRVELGMKRVVVSGWTPAALDWLGRFWWAELGRGEQCKVLERKEVGGARGPPWQCRWGRSLSDRGESWVGERLEFIVGGARDVEDCAVPGLRNPARWVGSGARGGATRHVVSLKSLMQCAESAGDLGTAWFRSVWEKKRSPAGRLRGESGEGLELVNGAS